MSTIEGGDFPVVRYYFDLIRKRFLSSSDIGFHAHELFENKKYLTYLGNKRKEFTEELNRTIKSLELPIHTIVIEKKITLKVLGFESAQDLYLKDKNYRYTAHDSGATYDVAIVRLLYQVFQTYLRDEDSVRIVFESRAMQDEDLIRGINLLQDQNSFKIQYLKTLALKCKKQILFVKSKCCGANTFPNNNIRKSCYAQIYSISFLIFGVIIDQYIGDWSRFRRLFLYLCFHDKFSLRVVWSQK